MIRNIGENMRDMRKRLKRAFKSSRDKEMVVVPIGYTLEFWNNIYDSIFERKQLKKALKCTKFASVNGRATCRWTRRGLRGIYEKFVSDFPSLLCYCFSSILVCHFYLLFYTSSNSLHLYCLYLYNFYCYMSEDEFRR